MAKRSKKEYEEAFNELLGVDVQWSKLPMEDLKQLAVVFGNPEMLLAKLGIEVGDTLRRRLRRALNRVRLEGSIGQLIKELLSEE